MGRCPLMGSYGMVIMLFAQVMYTCVTRKCAIKRSVTSTPGARTTPTSDASAVAVTTVTLVTATAANRKVSRCILYDYVEHRSSNPNADCCLEVRSGRYASKVAY